MYSRGCPATCEAQLRMLRAWFQAWAEGAFASASALICGRWLRSSVVSATSGTKLSTVIGTFSERYVCLLFASVRQQLFEWFRNPTRTPNRRVAHRLDVLNRSCTYIQLGMCLMPFATSA